jgi:CBS-domain-containing membrane protein
MSNPLTITSPAAPGPELELSDEDILDAMQRLPGYLDITTEDFRAIYHVAHAHAVERLLGRLRASQLMERDIEPLAPDMNLETAARSLLRQQRQALPVVDAVQRVVGMLSESDFLHAAGESSLLGLWLDSARGDFTRHTAHAHAVADAMRTPAVTVETAADAHTIAAAFQRHPGRSMPVVDANGRLCGLISRARFIAACSAVAVG